MSKWAVLLIGFSAQALFAGRFLIQWLLSERHKKVLAPSLFWKFSLLAAFLLFVYGYLRNDFAIMLGQGITYFIYIRNLQLQNKWEKAPFILRWFLWIFPLLIAFYFYKSGYDIHNLFFNEEIPLWLLILGALAQIIFSLRFVYQWVYSERKKKSCLPMGFWIMSLTGSLMILIYGVFRQDPVLIIGHIVGGVVYIRNIILKQAEFSV